MGLVYSRTDSGILVAEKGSQDERAIGRLLRDYDPDLRLVPTGRGSWSVYRYAGPDRPAEFICFWGSDDGTPWPLSGRILDRVRMLDKNTRVKAPNEDEINARVRERAAKKLTDETEELKQEYLAREKRSPAFHRGPHLRRRRELG